MNHSEFRKKSDVMFLKIRPKRWRNPMASGVVCAKTLPVGMKFLITGQTVSVDIIIKHFSSLFMKMSFSGS